MAANQNALLSIQDPKSFLKGLGKGLSLILIALIALFTYAYIQSSKTIKAIEEASPFEVIELSFDSIEKTPPAQPIETPIMADSPVQEDHPKIEHAPIDENETENQITTGQQPVVPATKNRTTDLKALYEHTEHGLLPKPVADNSPSTVYEAFKIPVDKSIYNKPVISLVYLTPEKSNELTQNAIDNLPQNVTFYLSPYDKNLDATKSLLKQSGRELWLKLYIGNDDLTQQDFGPLSLSGTAASEENIIRIKRTIGLTSEYVGIAIPNNSSFLARQHSIKPLLRLIRSYGLGIATLKTNNETEYISDFANETQTPFAQSNITIDKNPLKEDIISNLNKLKKIASEQGYAVGYMEGYPSTIETVSTWLNNQSNEDFNLVPLSAIADQTNTEKMKSIINGDQHKKHH